MNTHAIALNEKEIAIVRRVIVKFMTEKPYDSDDLAKEIVKSLKRNKLLKTYGQ